MELYEATRAESIGLHARHMCHFAVELVLAYVWKSGL